MSERPSHAAGNRLTTGVPGLDLILGGGLLPGALMFVTGPPGSGKTVMSQQIAFHVAHEDGKVLYFTTLSEPHSKLMAHVRDFTFYDPSLIGERLQFLNLEQALRQGAEETADIVVKQAREQRATLVVIDGFRGLLAFVEHPARVRELLYQLSAKLAVLGTTGLVTMEIEPGDPTLHMGMTIADVVIGLSQRQVHGTQQRVLEMVKARGSKPLLGFHSLVIDDTGETCYPRAEELPIKPAPGVPAERAAFGLPGLDAMLGGGLTAGSSTVLAGSLGSSKTLLALIWLLHGAALGEPGLLLGFHESAAQLIDVAAHFGMDLAGPVAAGTITLWTLPAVAIDANLLAGKLRALIDASAVRRLVIDSEYELEHVVGRERVGEYLTALVAYLRGEAVTVLLTKEVPDINGRPDFTNTPSAVLAENIILLQRHYVQPVARSSIAVLKMRYSSFDARSRDYLTTEHGITIGEPLESSAALQIKRTNRPRSKGG